MPQKTLRDSPCSIFHTLRTTDIEAIKNKNLWRTVEKSIEEN